MELDIALARYSFVRHTRMKSTDLSSVVSVFYLFNQYLNMTFALSATNGSSRERTSDQLTHLNTQQRQINL